MRTLDKLAKYGYVEWNELNNNTGGPQWILSHIFKGARGWRFGVGGGVGGGLFHFREPPR